MKEIMRKTGALLASGFGRDEFEKDLNNSFFGIYTSEDVKIIDIKYHHSQTGAEEPVHYSALIVFECEEDDE
jgi:hypothetical protein